MLNRKCAGRVTYFVSFVTHQNKSELEEWGGAPLSFNLMLDGTGISRRGGQFLWTWK
jgi:hypothetical protein